MRPYPGVVRLSRLAAISILFGACIPSGGLDPGADAGCMQEWVAPKPEEFVSTLPCGAPEYPNSLWEGGPVFATAGGEIPSGLYDVVQSSDSAVNVGPERLVLFADRRFIRTRYLGIVGRTAPGMSLPEIKEYSSGLLVTDGTTMTFEKNCSVIVNSGTPLEPGGTYDGGLESEQWSYGVSGCSELFVRREQSNDSQRWGVTYRRR